MKNRLLVFLLLASYLLFNNGCIKDKGGDNNATPQYHYDLAELKAYSYFKQGTYWIYRDTTSGIEDSVYVYENSETHNDYDYFDTKTWSTFYGYTYHYWMNQSWSQNGLTMIWRSKYKPGDFVGETYLMVLPSIFNRRYSPYSQDGDVTDLGLFEHLSISNTSFPNVAKFKDDENITENKSSTNFYVCKNIGIVRKEILDSLRVWDLVRYNIVQ